MIRLGPHARQTKISELGEAVAEIAGAGREGAVRGVDLPCFAGVDKRDWPLIIIPAAIPGGREREGGAE